MCKGEAGIKAGGVGASPKLVERHKFVFAQIVGDTFGDDFLNEFAEAFNELDGAVGLGKSHVFLVVLRDDGDNRLFPGGVVDSKVDGCADDSNEGFWVGGRNPFPDLVILARDSGCRGVGGVVEGVHDLIVGDGGEWSGFRSWHGVGDRYGLGSLVWEPGVGEEMSLVFGLRHPDGELWVGGGVFEGGDGGLADSLVP